MAEPREPSPTIRTLYPSLSEEELKKAEENLTRYIESTLRLYEAICADPERYALFQALTDEWSRPTITAKVDSPDSKQ